MKSWKIQVMNSKWAFKREHVFPFIVKLPNKRVFTSIDFGKGSINYTLKASIGNSSSYTTPATPPLNDNASNGSFSKRNFCPIHPIFLKSYKFSKSNRCITTIETKTKETNNKRSKVYKTITNTNVKLHNKYNIVQRTRSFSG